MRQSAARVIGLYLLAIVTFMGSAWGQTFRGEIKGVVQDSSGAALPDTAIKATNLGTGLVRSATSGANGDYTFVELPLGNYLVVATKSGFAEQKADNVEVQVSRVTTINFSLQIAQQATTVEVSATGAQIETASTALTGVVDRKMVQDLPINGRDFRQMLKMSPGVGPGTSPSVNGNRTRGNNFQIDGADNNDGFQNVSAVNQGGVSGIAGTLLPVDAIDQFSMQTNGSAEVGRNPGAVVNLVIKSGTNDLHGSLYYFNRNEAFAEPSPFQRDPTKARKVRNNQGGFSLGGKLITNKLFYFVTGEFQEANAAIAEPVTTPSPAWVADAEGILARYGIPVNPVSRNLLSFWPERTRVGPATPNNYTVSDSNIYDSYNGIIKLDWNATDKHTFSTRYYGGTGAQAARTGNAPAREYYQVAPSRMHNVSVVANSILSPRMVSQTVLGANYFLQTFGDFDRSYNPVAAGLNTGVAQGGVLSGAPSIIISGFSQVGVTQPLGRIDTTGHIVNTTSWNLGKHSVKFGGEYRRAHLDIFYNQNRLGSFSFDGSAGPWATDASLNQTRRAFADFMSGALRLNNAASIVQGELQRDYRQNSFDWFVHDQYQLNNRLTVNFGVRYTYNGPLYDVDNSITTFVPGAPGRGLVGPGNGLEHLYPRDLNNFAPRVGFALKLDKNDNMVIRGSYGIFYDVPAIAFFASNNPGNGGAIAVNGNPAGNVPVFSVVRNGGSPTAPVYIQSGQPVFGTTPVGPFGAFGVSQDLATPYTQNLNINIQRRLWKGSLLQTGYVGSLGRKLILTRNINQPRPGAGTIQSRRPFNAQYPDLGSINMVDSFGSSNYHSWQTQFTQTVTKGLSASMVYTYGKAIDFGSEPRNAAVTNNYNISIERGPAAFDLRQVFTGFLTYEVPRWSSALPKWLSDGWQVNSLFNFHSGQPVGDFRSGTDRSGTGNFADRLEVIDTPFAGVDRTLRRNASNTGAQVQWFRGSAFAAAVPGTFGTAGRNFLYGPGFGSVDPSIFKNFQLREGMKLQLRAEIFNIFNRVNLANPGVNFASSTAFGIITNTRNGGGAPGLGFGEPRNVQFAARIQF
jgi:hypothetical protein